MGYYRPDDGDLIVHDRERSIANPRDAHALGIGMVYQHFTLVPNMTVAENLVLARPDLPAILNWDHERRELERLLADMPFAVDLNAFAHTLAAGEKQKIEILKQLYLKRHILILDEPTSVLTPGEADEVLGLLHTMTRHDGLTVLMITHKFREVEAFADEVTVLRRGRLAGSGHVTALTTAEMAEMMIGSREMTTSIERQGAETGVLRLEIDGLHAANNLGVPALCEVSLSLYAGEIVGIAGVSGNGQRELVEVLAGQRPPDAGRLQINGQPYRATRAEMIRHKVFCLPEEPLSNACEPRMSVADNLAFRSFDRTPFAKAGWWLRHRLMVRAARDLISRYGIRTPSPEAQVGTLSGGNVQRTVLARELGGEVDVLIAANPCFGLDFAAVAEYARRSWRPAIAALPCCW
jgi:simple sugar transport system ATP-binding protein